MVQVTFKYVRMSAARKHAAAGHVLCACSAITDQHPSDQYDRSEERSKRICLRRDTCCARRVGTGPLTTEIRRHFPALLPEIRVRIRASSHHAVPCTRTHSTIPCHSRQRSESLSVSSALSSSIPSIGMVEGASEDDRSRAHTRVATREIRKCPLLGRVGRPSVSLAHPPVGKVSLRELNVSRMLRKAVIMASDAPLSTWTNSGEGGRPMWWWRRRRRRTRGGEECLAQGRW